MTLHYFNKNWFVALVTSTKQWDCKHYPADLLLIYLEIKVFLKQKATNW